MTEQLLKLPEKPGTVIAIGGWWLVRLPGYEGARSAWELLPFATEAIRNHAESIGVKAQCVYGDEWVLAEAEQEGGYVIIADPRDEPSGIQYFKPTPARLAASSTERETVYYPIGTRVYLRAAKALRGEITAVNADGTICVEWDNGAGVTRLEHELIGPEAALPPERPVWDGKSEPPKGARVQRRDDPAFHGTVKGTVAIVEHPRGGANGIVTVHWDGWNGTENIGMRQIEPAEEQQGWER